MIAVAVGVTPGQVSAVAAHVRMGTYTLPEPGEPVRAEPPVAEPVERASDSLRMLKQLDGAAGRGSRLNPILPGKNWEYAQTSPLAGRRFLES